MVIRKGHYGLKESSSTKSQVVDLEPSTFIRNINMEFPFNLDEI